MGLVNTFNAIYINIILILFLKWKNAGNELSNVHNRMNPKEGSFDPSFVQII